MDPDHMEPRLCANTEDEIEDNFNIDEIQYSLGLNTNRVKNIQVS